MTQVGPIVLRDVTPRAPIFTTATAAAAAAVSSDTASRGLARLQEQGLVTRLVRGLWADTRHPDFSPYAVVPFLLARSPSQEGQPSVGYVSFLSALQLHGILSQIPPAIQVAVAEQHETVHTPVGDFGFHQIQPDLDGSGLPSATATIGCLPADLDGDRRYFPTALTCGPLTSCDRHV